MKYRVWLLLREMKKVTLPQTYCHRLKVKETTFAMQLLKKRIEKEISKTKIKTETKKIFWKIESRME